MNETHLTIDELLNLWSQLSCPSTLRRVADYVRRLEDAYEQIRKPVLEACDELPGILNDVRELAVLPEYIDERDSIIQDLRSLNNLFPDPDDIEELNDIQSNC